MSSHIVRTIMVALLAALPAVAAPAVPPLHFHTPPQFTGIARGLGQQTPPHKIEELMHLVGSTSVEPVEVTLTPEGSSLANAVPAWASGYAMRGSGAVVLMPGRNPRYPDDSLEETFLHELTHVFIDRALNGRNVPRWFNEGTAVIAGRAWTLEDQTRFSYAGMLGSSVTPAELDALFLSNDASAASRAYVISEAFVRDLIRAHGPGAISAIVRATAQGVPFDRAFFDQTTYTPDRAFERFWSEQGWRRNLLPLLTSSALLWLIITGMAISAIRRRRWRDAKVTELWEAEEEREELTFVEDDVDVDDEPVN